MTYGVHCVTRPHIDYVSSQQPGDLHYLVRASENETINAFSAVAQGRGYEQSLCNLPAMAEYTGLIANAERGQNTPIDLLNLDSGFWENKTQPVITITSAGWSLH